MQEKILQQLAEIEQQHNVRILYACESGSRAWGFPSPDSDYDVRFLYVKSMQDYLSINDSTEIIELPVNDLLDIGGWELRKALRLFHKSNVALYEWLQSPIIYCQKDDFVHEIKLLAAKYFSLRAGTAHYLGITKGTWKEIQANEVKIKKYFYCLRPILAAKWIILKNEIPPMEFSKLIKLVDNKEIVSEINNLLKTKAASDEKATVKPIPILHNFIQENIEFCEENLPEQNEIQQDFEELNELFRTTI
jgi:predicted nucleotidyltransferase